jgi:hypothetical protein
VGEVGRVVSRRGVRIILWCLLAAVPIAAGTGAYGWYRLDQMVEVSWHIEPHVPGTYYFARFRGGVLGPFQPQDEISEADALAGRHYVVGT